MMEREYLDTRQIQMAEYDILVALTDFFEKNDIEYILCGGTMLGAVRHNGFIPWDDDIDIFVLRKDYEKLKNLARKNFTLGRYKISIPGMDKHIYPFIKVIDESLRIEESTRDSDNNNLDQCLWIDVFPLDHFPDDEKTHRKYLKKIRFYMHAITVGTLSEEFYREKGYYSSIIKRIGLFLGMCVYRILGGYKKIGPRLDTFSKKMNEQFKTSNHVGNGVWSNGMNDYFEVRMVTPRIKHVFEGGEFYIPENYDGYLTTFYGDYMALPPEDKRKTHEMNVYRCENRKQTHEYREMIGDR